jgi:hypothetical protein
VPTEKAIKSRLRIENRSTYLWLLALERLREMTVNFRSVWATFLAQGEPELYSETLPEKIKDWR